jgi:hypothetical protein
MAPVHRDVLEHDQAEREIEGRGDAVEAAIGGDMASAGRIATELGQHAAGDIHRGDPLEAVGERQGQAADPGAEVEGVPAPDGADRGLDARQGLRHLCFARSEEGLAVLGDVAQSIAVEGQHPVVGIFLPIAFPDLLRRHSPSSGVRETAR